MSTKSKKVVKKNTVPKVRLSEAALAKDEARAAELKEAKKAERAAAKAAVEKSPSKSKYSTQVTAAIANFLNAPAAVHVPWTEAREKEADIKIHETRIAELKVEIGTRTSLLWTYEKNLKILREELAALNTQKVSRAPKKGTHRKDSGDAANWAAIIRE
jgi:cysteinyl-tRNA synthetase